MNLKNGSRGSKVGLYQQHLIDVGLGALLGAAGKDEKFGGFTANATKVFQMRHGLEATGIADEATQKKAEEEAAKMIATRSHGTGTSGARSSSSLLTPVNFGPSSPSIFENRYSDTGHEYLRERIVAAATAELGRGEQNRDNQGSDLARYRKASGNSQGGPWCADLISFIGKQADANLLQSTSLAMGFKHQFETTGSFHTMDSGHRPKRGDLIVFARGKENWQGHVGIVTSVDSDGTIHTIEGNKQEEAFRGLEEGKDYRWSAAQPDKVRNVSYTPEQLREERCVGFGDIVEHARNKGLQPQVDTMMMASNIPAGNRNTRTSTRNNL